MKPEFGYGMVEHCGWGFVIKTPLHHATVFLFLSQTSEKELNERGVDADEH